MADVAVRYYGGGEKLGALLGTGSGDFGLYNGDVTRVDVAPGLTLTVFSEAGQSGDSKTVEGPAEASTDFGARSYRLKKTGGVKDTADRLAQSTVGRSLTEKETRALTLGGAFALLLLLVSSLS